MGEPRFREKNRKKITNGTWDAFWGPIKDQNGNEKVAEGQKMSDQDILSFSWFVEGVEGEIPVSRVITLKIKDTLINHRASILKPKNFVGFDGFKLLKIR